MSFHTCNFSNQIKYVTHNFTLMSTNATVLIPFRTPFQFRYPKQSFSLLSLLCLLGFLVFVHFRLRGGLSIFRLSLVASDPCFRRSKKKCTLFDLSDERPKYDGSHIWYLHVNTIEISLVESGCSGQSHCIVSNGWIMYNKHLLIVRKVLGFLVYSGQVL